MEIEMPPTCEQEMQSLLRQARLFLSLNLRHLLDIGTFDDLSDSQHKFIAFISAHAIAWL